MRVWWYAARNLCRSSGTDDGECRRVWCGGGEEVRGKELNKCGQEMLTGSLPGQEVTTQQL